MHYTLVPSHAVCRFKVVEMHLLSVTRSLHFLLRPACRSNSSPGTTGAPTPTPQSGSTTRSQAPPVPNIQQIYSAVSFGGGAGTTAPPSGGGSGSGGGGAAGGGTPVPPSGPGYDTNASGGPGSQVEQTTPGGGDGGGQTAAAVTAPVEAPPPAPPQG